MIQLKIAQEVQNHMGTRYKIEEENNGDITIDCFYLMSAKIEVTSVIGIFEKDGVKVYKVDSDGYETEEKPFSTWTGAIQWVFLYLIRYDAAVKIVDFYHAKKYNK